MMSSTRVALFGACVVMCAAYAQAATDGGESLPCLNYGLHAIYPPRYLLL